MGLVVRELWRFPVKSLGGERVGRTTVTADGLAGDRAFGIVDVVTGFVLTARREPGLLGASASYADADGTLAITLPDGSLATDDAALSSWLGRPVRLAAARDDVAGTYETQVDVDHEDTAEWFTWQGPAGPFHDSARTRVSIVSVATVGSWDTRRFRANVVCDGAGEDELVGRTVCIGDVELDVQKHIDRCVMVTRPQPGGIERDLEVLRTITRERAGNLGIGALVRTAGVMSVGDEVVLGARA
jgi:uncharacterized protein YcbX